MTEPAPTAPQVTPPAEGHRDIPQIKDVLPLAANKFELEKNAAGADQDDIITHANLGTLKAQATADLDHLKDKGLLTPDAAEKFRDQIDKLQAQDKQNPATPSDKSDDVLKEAQMGDTLEAVVKGITNGELWLLVKTQGESQKAGFVGLLKNPKCDFLKDKTEIQIGANGADLAAKLETTLLLSEEAKAVIQGVLTKVTTDGFLKDIVAIRKNGDEIEVKKANEDFVPLKIAPQAPPAPEKHDIPPDESTERGRLALKSYLEAQAGHTADFNIGVLSAAAADKDENLQKEISGILTRIQKMYKGAIQEIKYDAGLYVSVVEKADTPAVWKEVKFTPTAAETYLLAEEKFNQAIEDGKEKANPIFRVIAELLAGFLGKDLDGILKDKTFIGTIARSLFSIDLGANGAPEMNPGLKKQIKEMIDAKAGNVIPNSVQGLGGGDTKVKAMLDDIGTRFNIPNSLISLEEESQTLAVAEESDTENAHETSGVLTLKVPTALQAVGIVVYAQRSSEGITGKLTKGLNKMMNSVDSKYAKILTQGLKIKPDETYNKQREKDGYPDNVTATYEGTPEGSYRVKITWLSSGNMKDLSEEEKPEKTEKPEKSGTTIAPPPAPTSAPQAAPQEPPPTTPPPPSSSSPEKPA